MRAALAALALMLCGCQPQAPDGSPAGPPADAPETPTAAQAQPRATDFSGPMIARGTEPFWAVKMEGTTFTLQRPDHADAVFEAPGGRISPGKGVWTATAADGRTMTVTLFVSECSDGMSDRRYPMTAEVELSGETLRGCANKRSDEPLPHEG